MSAFSGSSVERDFIEAIRRRPDTDLPRLIYADWLEQRADPRGEFIRVQCLLARLPRVPGREDLKARERSLLSQHYEAWIEEPLVLLGVTAAEFSRGLIECLDIAADQWLAQSTLIFERAPLLRHLKLTRSTPYLEQLAESDTLERLDTLSLEENAIGNAGAEILERSTHLHRLRKLDLRANRLSAPVIQRLAESPRLSPSVVLDVRDNRLRYQDALNLRNSYDGRVIV